LEFVVVLQTVLAILKLKMTVFALYLDSTRISFGATSHVAEGIQR